VAERNLYLEIEIISTFPDNRLMEHRRQMASHRTLKEEDLRHFVLGASILGTGGGGLIAVAEQIVGNIIGHNKRITLIHPEDVKDEALGITAAIFGGGITPETLETFKMDVVPPLYVTAAYGLSKYLNKEFSFVYALEIGTQNSLEPMQMAAFMDIPIVDGDCVGRAVPELPLTTLSLGVKLNPIFALSTFQGDTIIVTTAANEKRSEIISRAIAGVSGNLLYFSGYTVEGSIFKRAVIPGTITTCIRIGEAIHARTDVFNNIIKITGGKIAFKGEVTRINMESGSAFFIGTVELLGIDEFEGETYRVWFKNEFLISWRNEAIDITCPDSICIANSETGIGKVTYGKGFRNEMKQGEPVTVLAIPAASIWKTPRGLAQFNPAYFDFDIPYNDFMTSIE